MLMKNRSGVMIEDATERRDRNCLLLNIMMFRVVGIGRLGAPDTNLDWFKMHFHKCICLTTNRSQTLILIEDIF
jgi:hypothetical protein